jgi:nucleotide-binding universal stress UspA family protein
VLCGVNGGPRATEAVHQASRVAAPDGLLILVSVIDSWNPLAQQGAASRALDAERALAEARRAVGRGMRHNTYVRKGWTPDVLLDDARAAAADLIAVGMHDAGRSRGIAGSSVATRVLHKANASVLLARCGDSARPPRIIVGIDGSEEAAWALDVAADVGDRLGAEVIPIAASGGDLDLAAVQAKAIGSATPVVDSRAPVEALVAACALGDLLVVGSRGLSGLRRLGSVSERVAHEAQCSVLVVRSPSR